MVTWKSHNMITWLSYELSLSTGETIDIDVKNSLLALLAYTGVGSTSIATTAGDINSEVSSSGNDGEDDSQSSDDNRDLEENS